MAEQEAKDNAAKARIVSHLNADHHDSLVRYLEYYCNVSVWKSHDVRMSSLDLNGMTLSCQGKDYRIPFNPPMSSYRDARERAVRMDKEALEGLGRSDITITEFIPATAPRWAIAFWTISFIFVAYSQRWWFAQGQFVERFLGSGFAKLSWYTQPYVISFMLFMHTWESIYFAYSRLLKHSINPRSSLFWKWWATGWIEGFNVFLRFDQLVQEKREAKAKQQH